MGIVHEKEIYSFSDDLKFALKNQQFLKHDINYGDNIKVIKLANELKNYAIKIDDFYVENDFFSYFNELKNRRSSIIPMEHFISVTQISIKEKSLFCTNRLRIYSRFEYVRQSLRNSIEKLKTDDVSSKERLKTPEFLYIIAAVIQTLQKLEEFNIFHGNIRPETILLDEEGIIKLTDSKFMLKESSYQSYLFGQYDRFYLCPSMLQQLKFLNTNPKINYQKSNVFCLGLTVLESMTLCDINLIYDMSEYQILKKKLEDNIFKASKLYAKELVELLKKMLQLSENMRIGYEGILNEMKNLQPSDKINMKSVLFDNKTKEIRILEKERDFTTKDEISLMRNSNMETPQRKFFKSSDYSNYSSAATKKTTHMENIKNSPKKSKEFI